MSLEQIYLEFFLNKYNINPIAGIMFRLGAIHTKESNFLISQVFKANPHFLNKTLIGEVLYKMRKRMSGPIKPVYGRPVSDANKKLISDLFRKDVYLYEASTLNLIKKYDRLADLVKDIRI